MTDVNLNNKMLDVLYSENGVTFPDMTECRNFLNNKGYRCINGEWIGKGAKRARVYKLRDCTGMTAWENLKYVSKGYLVSFGGEPIGCYDLKYTKIKRPPL